MDEDRGQSGWLVSILQARERERARISRILHDEVGQILSAAGLQLDLLRMECTQMAGVSERILEAQKLLEQAVVQVRDLSCVLNPSIVERSGLQFALERLVGRCRRGFPGTVRLEFDPSAQVPVEAAQAFYRIAEQALDNAVRHARCSTVDVLFQQREDGIGLEVRDDGSGFVVEQVRCETGGLGLRLINHHATEAGLELSLASAPERGTIVKALYRRAKRPGSSSPRNTGYGCSPAASG